MLKEIIEILRVIVGCVLFTLGLIVLAIGVLESSVFTVLGAILTVVLGVGIAGPKRMLKELKRSTIWFIPLP